MIFPCQLLTHFFFCSTYFFFPFRSVQPVYPRGFESHGRVRCAGSLAAPPPSSSAWCSAVNLQLPQSGEHGGSYILRELCAARPRRPDGRGSGHRLQHLRLEHPDTVEKMHD